jgi:hypothetical protein
MAWYSVKAQGQLYLHLYYYYYYYYYILNLINIHPPYALFLLLSSVKDRHVT